jgi:hypothetical protein
MVANVYAIIWLRNVLFENIFGRAEREFGMPHREVNKRPLARFFPSQLRP